ncbi:MAG: ATP-grasp domain-containing protein [Rhodospirillales bacterium]|nr:MAG: ATP-grasp domain-containing protein [Rhodospirillales bacterium]
MPLHVIVVDREIDFPWPAPGRRIMRAANYVREAARELPASARVINLCRDSSYMSLGYYCSLMAEARGQKVIPSVEVMLDLHWKRLLRIALPEVQELVAKSFKAPPEPLPHLEVDIFFGLPDDARLSAVARRVFELFRCPLLRLDLRYRAGWSVKSIRPLTIRELTSDQQPMLKDALDRYTHAAWRPPQRASGPGRYSIAILHDPEEHLPPSDPRALDRFARAGEKLGLEVQLITRTDYTRLLEFDALFIRETTALDHHTYRFAKKAEAEGMPVIDDPRSILRCTNKICLAELLESNDVPAPRTLILDRRRIGRAEREFGYPFVVKIPDSAFSRGVFRIHNRTDLEKFADRAFKESDLVVAQEFIETAFDWRVGILEGRPLYVCKYFMARGHWQIIKHEKDRRYVSGAYAALAVDQAPAPVVDAATRAARLIGDGLYGVDLKETANGVYVIEVNDNPSIEAGVEDSMIKDRLYLSVMETFIRRLDKRSQAEPREARSRRNGQRAPSAHDVLGTDDVSR